LKLHCGSTRNLLIKKGAAKVTYAKPGARYLFL
jgi:hypothetical protein